MSLLPFTGLPSVKIGHRIITLIASPSELLLTGSIANAGLKVNK